MSAWDSPDAALVATLLPPYARALGMEIDRVEEGMPVLAFDFAERIHGRPGFVHGGALAGLLEMASVVALRCDLRRSGAELRFKPVNITVEFMRGAAGRRTFALAQVIRTGRRIANLRADAWQDDRGKTVATAWMNVRLAPKG